MCTQMSMFAAGVENKNGGGVMGIIRKDLFGGGMVTAAGGGRSRDWFQ